MFQVPVESTDGHNVEQYSVLPVESVAHPSLV